MSLATEMTNARKKRGVTQPQLAEVLGVSQAFLSMVEKGHEEPSDDLAQRIRGWIASGRGARTKAARGPYRRGRTTIA